MFRSEPIGVNQEEEEEEEEEEWDERAFDALAQAKAKAKAAPCAPPAEIVFKAAYKSDGKFLLSNFYGGAEFDYMIPKFDVPGNGKVVEMFRRWQQGDYSHEERWIQFDSATLEAISFDVGTSFDWMRYFLSSCRIECGTIVPQGMKLVGGKIALKKQKTNAKKPGYMWWSTQARRSYEAGYAGEAFHGSGILMKLAAGSWSNKKRRNVLEHLSGMTLDTMTPPLNLYHPTKKVGEAGYDAENSIVSARRRVSMKTALANKYSPGSVYRAYLLSTGDSVLKEAGQDPIFGSGPGCANLLGSLLMELRDALRV
jgi:hypothetical protein